MEEKQKTYINAFVLKTGERIMVAQDGKGSPFFTDATGKKHHIETLDISEAFPPLFDQSEQMKSLTDIMKSFDVKAQDEHRAKIAEREYWRKLRGDIFIEVFRNPPLHHKRSTDELLDATQYLVNELWQQDQDFSIRKISKNEAT